MRLKVVDRAYPIKKGWAFGSPQILFSNHRVIKVAPTTGSSVPLHKLDQMQEEKCQIQLSLTSVLTHHLLGREAGAAVLTASG